MVNGDKTVEAAKEVAGKAAGYLPAVVPPDEASGKTGKQLSAAEYVAIRTPRIPDLPSSAPIYDSLTKSKTYPRLSCMISSDPGYIERNARRYRVSLPAKSPTSVSATPSKAPGTKPRFPSAKTRSSTGGLIPR